MERADDVGVNEVPPAMGDNMRLVQSGGVEDSFHPADASAQARAIKDRTDLGGERRCANINTNDLVFQVLQSADQRFTKVSSASCDQNLHACVVTSFSLGQMA